MKNVIFVGFFVLTTCFSVFAASQKMKVPRLKTVGVFKNPVLAQTAPELVEKKSGYTVLKKYYIARWGVHRFEYGIVQYSCRSSKCEMLGEPAALKFYGSCTGFNKNGRPVCKNLVSERVDITDSYTNSNQSNDKRAWYTCEDYGSPCQERDELNEFPSRYSSEDQDLPSGI